MSPWASVLLLWAAAFSLLSGCADNAMVLKGQVATYEKKQGVLAQQNQQIQERAVALDRANQELNRVVSQAQQQTKLAEDQLAVLREQLRSATAQLAQLQAEKSTVEQKAQTLTASLQRQGGVPISPNNSYLQSLPAIHESGVDVRRDGDVIRVELPAAKLFDASSARLLPGAANVLLGVANELRRSYPEQMIGIEGHTDASPVLGGQWRNNHELSAARAVMVYDTLVSLGHFREEQLFVVGQGANRPVVSNATPEGKQRNRRIELVVYPERRT
jgi:flagellar motor protein MotB